MRAGEALLLVLALSAAAPARAAEPSAAKPLIKEGERLYATGKYRQAAETLRKAYDLQPNPLLIYNIARAYDQSGDLALALEFYQRYVASTEGTDATLLKRSALSIERLRGLVAKEEAEKKTREAEEQRLEEAKAAADKAQAEAEAVRKAQAEADARRQAEADAEVRQRAKEKARSKAASYTFGALAIATAGAGAAFGYESTRSVAGFRAAVTPAQKLGFESAAKTEALFADLGFGLGIAAAVTAVVLYPRGGGDVSVGVAPNGAVVQGHF